VYGISIFIPEGICFAAFVAFVACCYSIQFLTRQTTRKGQKAKTHTRIRKLTKTQQKNTNEKLHNITKATITAKQIPSERKISYTPEDGHVGRNMSVEQRQLNARPSTIKLHADGNLTSKLIQSYSL
jgi:mevalonate kinase